VVILLGDSGVILISAHGGRFCVTRVLRFVGTRIDLFSLRIYFNEKQKKIF
jgi:hypothetical protein